MMANNTGYQFLQQKLGIRYPVIQAPMAGTATPELAAAVSNAGGIGSLGIGAATVSQAREMITQTRALTDDPFDINVFCHQSPMRDPLRESAWLEYLSPLFSDFGAETPADIEGIDSSFLTNDEMFQMLLEEKPAIVSFHFGFPEASKIAALKNAGVTLFATATSLAEAREIEAAGIDAIVAQGVEAGGHRGMFDPDADDQKLPMSVLVRTLVKNQHLPVIAAGGIMDGYGIRAALDLGAAAAQLGTAFVLCPESAASQAYRGALQSERSGNTMHTSALTGRPARAIANRLMIRANESDSPLPPAYPDATTVSRALNEAARHKGSDELGSFWAGQGAPLARELSGADLMRTLVHEMGEV